MSPAVRGSLQPKTLLLEVTFIELLVLEGKLDFFTFPCWDLTLNPLLFAASGLFFVALVNTIARLNAVRLQRMCKVTRMVAQV